MFCRFNMINDDNSFESSGFVILLCLILLTGFVILVKQSDKVIYFVEQLVEQNYSVNKILYFNDFVHQMVFVNKIW